MLTSNEKSIMAKHLIDRRNKHLARLKEEKVGFRELQTWTKFYQKLLIKYNVYEVERYEHS